MLHRIFTWLSTGKSGPVDESTTSLLGARKVLERLQRLEIALEDLETTVAGQSQQLQRLRGRLTGGIRRGGSPTDPASLDDIPVGDKAALREYARQRGLFNVVKATKAE